MCNKTLFITFLGNLYRETNYRRMSRSNKKDHVKTNSFHRRWFAKQRKNAEYNLNLKNRLYLHFA